MLLKDTVYLICMTNLALITGYKTISVSFAKWGNWEEYSDCTKTCGSGEKTRKRTCSIPGKCPTDGLVSQTIVCNVQPCTKPTKPTPKPKPRAAEPSTTEFTDYTDGDTTEVYRLTTLSSDDADDKQCKPFVDCNKDNEVALKYCPNYCSEEEDDKHCKPFVDCNKDNEVALKYCPNYCFEGEICKTFDCAKPKASTFCPISCAEGREEDIELCKTVDCTKPKASTLCPISCAEEPEPPTQPTTCDYGQYCALVDCTKTGATDLCPDQCSKPMKKSFATKTISKKMTDAPPAVLSVADECNNRKPVDIGFMLDESKSVKAKDWKKAENFTKIVAKAASIQKDMGQASVTTFDKSSRLKIRFNEYQDYDAFATAVDNLKQHRGGTNIINALNKGLEEMFQTKNGMRDESEKIAVLMTDGKDKRKDISTYKEVGKKYQERNIKLLIIGVGDVDRDLLKELVRDEKDLFVAENFDQLLNTVVGHIAENVQGACEDDTTVSVCGTSCEKIITVDGEPCSNTWADGCGEIPPPVNFTSESTLYELCPNECAGKPLSPPKESNRTVTNYSKSTTFHFQCKTGYCYPAYGNPINGKSEDVADACSKDKGCKAYQYSSDNGYGHLCSAITDAGLWGDYLNCIKM